MSLLQLFYRHFSEYESRKTNRNMNDDDAIRNFL